MFWGLIMEPNKRYTQTVEKSFHVSMAALDVASADDDVVQVTLCYDGSSYLLCSLKKGIVWQVPLDLHFQEGNKIAFTCNGQSRVHLTGYLIPEDDDVDLDEDLEEEEEVEEEEEEEVPSRKRSKRKAKVVSQGNKKSKRTKQKVESSDDQDLDETDDEDLAKYKSLLNDLQTCRSSEEEVSDNDDEDDDNDGNDDEDDDDDDEVDDSDDDDDDDEDVEEEEEEEKVQKKSSKAQGNKNKEVQQQQQQSKKKGKQQLVNGKVAKQDQQKKNKGENQQQNTANEQKKRVLEGGVIIKELKNGTGAPVKPGKFISVYFVGRLQNGKKFDSTTQGDGFKFRLGKGEVIKGWDIGIAGMKVGAKRQITIPPHMGYGAKGFPPTIPGNSTLVFDVELKSIH